MHNRIPITFLEISLFIPCCAGQFIQEKNNKNVGQYINNIGQLDGLAQTCVNTLSPRQNGYHFPAGIFKWILFNGNDQISIRISHKFIPKVPIDNKQASVQIMAWHRTGNKALSEPKMA